MHLGSSRRAPSERAAPARGPFWQQGKLSLPAIHFQVLTAAIGGKPGSEQAKGTQRGAVQFHEAHPVTAAAASFFVQGSPLVGQREPRLLTHHTAPKHRGGRRSWPRPNPTEKAHTNGPVHALPQLNR